MYGACVRPASSCSHSVAPTLAFMLPSQHNACPRCIVASYIDEVAAVQRRYNALEGAFRSRTYVGECSKAFKSEWCWAKLAAANRIADIEDLLKDNDVSAQDKFELKEALELWDSAKETLSRLPGVQYVDGAGNSTPELSQFPGQDSQQSCFELFAASPSHSPGSSQDTTSQWIPLPNHPMHFSLGIPPISTEHPTPQSFVHQLQCRKRAAASRRKRHSSLQQTGTTPPMTSSTETLVIRCNQSKAITYSQPAKSTSKRVRFSDFATVSSEYLSVSNPSPFHPLSQETIMTPHFPHTDADKKRHRSKWARHSRVYEPGAWASPAYSKKAETSFFRIHPFDMVAYVEAQLRQEEDEMWVAEQFKLISQVWLELWREEDVTPSPDVEGLVVEGSGGVHP